MIARQQGRELTEIASEIDADLVAGSSLKAALDLNWENPEERNLALAMVLGVLSQRSTHLEQMLEHRFSIQNPAQFLDFGISQKTIFR